MKPGVGTYDRFKELFDKYSKEAGKEQYLIPYFIAAHPGTRDEDMLELALWLKRNGFRADQVQAFLPSPMATATAMYHSGKNPLHKVSRSRRKCTSPGARGAPPAQGVPALSRPEQLAAAARSAAADGALGPHWQRQATSWCRPTSPSARVVRTKATASPPSRRRPQRARRRNRQPG